MALVSVCLFSLSLFTESRSGLVLKGHSLSDMKFSTTSVLQQQRGLLHRAQTVILNVVLLSTLFCLISCGTCSTNEMQSLLECDACESYCRNDNAGLEDIFLSDASAGCKLPNSLKDTSVDSVCPNSYTFCFPSTLSSFSSGEHYIKEAGFKLSSSRSNDAPYYSMFKLFDGRSISCSLDLKDGLHDPSFIQPSSSFKNDIFSCGRHLDIQMGISFGNKEKIESSYSEDEDRSSFHVEINPPMLDWGHKNLYVPSPVFLAVANTHNKSILHVYKPYSTDVQFYPCNSSYVLLGPGEAASICFIFLPRRLGLSSAHLILQTNSGGFVIQVKGFGIEPPYGIQPLIGLDASSSGQWSKNLSLFNPSDEILYVEEVMTWLSISQGNISYTAGATCTVENSRGFDEVTSNRDRLDVKNDLVGRIRMRPHRKWDIGSHSTVPLIEMDFSFDYEGYVQGVFCMQFLRDSQDIRDIVMVPIEFEMDGKSMDDDFIRSVSISIEPLRACGTSKSVTVSISLKNDAQSILRVVKISKVPDTKLFQIRYMEGLLLFPNNITQIAVVSYNHPIRQALDMNCKLLIVTNESSGPQIEIPCQDISNICSKYELDSSDGDMNQFDKGESSNAKIGYLGSAEKVSSLSKVPESMEADEFVLRNWKSQGTSTNTSVIHDHEVLFPMVQVGAHLSEWITVKNPSQLPIVMQLVLNSGEVIDKCRGQDGFIPAHSYSNLVKASTSPSRYGFSIADNALTEAYVQPHGTASFGPIFFHPSKRCRWKGSVLIRNNLTGVEWITLRGFGGSLSLVLLEDSEPVDSLEFKFELPISLNVSPTEILNQMQDTASSCSGQLSKEVYAKNSGDLPLDVKKIGVSGKEGQLDGFFIHSCKSFSLEPGESAKLLISYKTDFSGTTVHRDLEFSFATGGIFVIPMKASLPLYVVNFCNRSMFWMKVRKFSLVILFAASLTFLVFGGIFPHMMAWSSHDYLYKSEKSSIASIRTSGNSSRAHQNQINDKLYAKIDGFMTAVGKDKSSLLSSPDDDNVDDHNVTPDFASPSQHSNVCGKENLLLDAEIETLVPCSLLHESVAVENSDLLDASQPGNLTVRVGKDKRRRRRRRKGAGAGLTSLFDVSSSQSGNSTPSSPLSPSTSLTPNKVSMCSADVDQPIKARDPFGQVIHQHCDKLKVPEANSKAKRVQHEVSMKDCNNSWSLSGHELPAVPRKIATKPVLFPSATFPCTRSRGPSMMCPSNNCFPPSSIAPYSRAPGPKLYNKISVPPKEKVEHGNKYTYDIWADHLSGLTSMATNMSRETESSSGSFFVRGPQTFEEKSQQKSVDGKRLPSDFFRLIKRLATKFS